MFKWSNRNYRKSEWSQVCEFFYTFDLREKSSLLRDIAATYMIQIAIIGGGITGLTLAYYLQQKGISYQLFEAEDRVGGNIKSVHQDGYVLEKGPNTLQLNDKLYEFFHQLGIHEELIFAEPKAKYRYILKQGRYRQLPTGPISLIFSSTFSFKAKRQLLGESNKEARELSRESIDHFFRRRLGDEWTDYAVYPFISGIYAGNPKELLVDQAFPKVKEWEQAHGSIIKGMRKMRAPQVHKGIFSFPNGLEHLTQTLYSSLQAHIKLSSPVDKVESLDSQYLIHTNGSIVKAQQVVFTLPAYQVAELIEDMAPEMAKALTEIYYPPVAMTHMAYKRTDISHPLDGFGALHNQKEPSNTLGTIFASTIFPHRCPKDEVLLTTFVGGALHPEKALIPEAQLHALVIKDHKRFLGASAEPVYKSLIQWEKAIPQYDERSLAYQAFIDPLRKKGLHFGGNWTGGISVWNSMEKAEKLAADCFLV